MSDLERLAFIQKALERARDRLGELGDQSGAGSMAHAAIHAPMLDLQEKLDANGRIVQS